MSLAAALTLAGVVGLAGTLTGTLAGMVVLRARARDPAVAALIRDGEALRLRCQVADELARQERERAEQASAGMFELLSGLVAAEEGARGQLSAELHDTVAQSLMRARALLATPDGAAGLAAELVGEAEEQLRAVMARARPPALAGGDLAVAVAGLRDDLAHRYGLSVSISWPERPYPVPLPVAVTVYRFFQEALLNVVKHSDGDRARLALQVGDEVLTATVSDSGPGFDPAAVQPRGGRQVGLGLLAERARLAGGRVTVASAPGRPTLLTLELPVRGGVFSRAGAGR